ncbi:hypothetical protein [Thermococcus sp.]
MVTMASSCREIVLKVGVGLVVLYLTGFVILYDAIRKLICISVDCSQYWGPYASESPVYGLDFFVMVFVVGTLFLMGVLYSSARPSGSEKVNGDVEDSSNE